MRILLVLLLSALSCQATTTNWLIGTYTTALTVSASDQTFIFSNGCSFVSGVWPTTGAIHINTGVSNIVIDGGVNGLIWNTNNGTSLGNQSASTGINGSALNNITIRNLTITNMYRHDRGSADENRYGGCIDITGSGLTVENCLLGDGDTLLAITLENAGTEGAWTVNENHTIRGNTFTRFNHGFFFGSSYPYTVLRGVLFESNRMDNLDVWNVPSSTQLHLDAVIFIAEGKIAGTNSNTFIASNVVFRANHIGPNVGTNNTAGIFCDTYFPMVCTDWKFYNNLFTYNSVWNNGCLNIFGVNILIANNTFVGVAGGTANNGTGMAVKLGGGCTLLNNVFSLNGTILNSDGSAAPVLVDYNVYDQFDNTGTGFYISPAGSQMAVTEGRAYFQSLGGDTNSVYVFPLVSTAIVNNQPTASATNGFSNPYPTSAFLGTNLTSRGITNDFYGTARPASGAWTMGFAELGSEPPPTVTYGTFRGTIFSR